MATGIDGGTKQNVADKAGGRDGDAKIELRQVDLPGIFLLATRLAISAMRHVADQILDMDHSDRLIEGLAIDWHPGMPGFTKPANQFGERLVDLDRLDICARDHDVSDVNFAQAENIVQQPSFFRGKGTI